MPQNDCRNWSNNEQPPTSHKNAPSSRVLISMSWLPSPEYADWWYNFSWKGIIWVGGLAAFATAATVLFTIIQFWSDKVRDENAEIRYRSMEVALADANARTREADAKTVTAALELEKLRRQVAPRILSSDQQERLYKLLFPFGRQVVSSGRPKVVLISYGMDTEGAVLGSQLLAILERAGIDAVNLLASEVPIGSFAVGVHIAGASNDLTFALSEGIGESGIEVTLGTTLPSLNPEYKTPSVPAAVLIGTRPVRIPQ